MLNTNYYIIILSIYSEATPNFLCVYMSQTNQPLVSIIVPIYNVEAYLEKCLDSLVSQIYSNIEILLIDDGSTDNSGLIADKYANEYDYISVTHNTNSGLSSARNDGLKQANGEWIAFVDSDDYVRRDYISTLLKIAQNKDAQISTCKYMRVSNEKNANLNLWQSKLMSGHEAIDESFINMWSPDVWQCLFKASIFKDNNIAFPEGREYESVAVKIKALYYADKVSFTNEKLYYYVNRGDSITHKPFTQKTLEDKLAALDDIQSFIDQTSDENIGEYYEYYAFQYLSHVLSRLSLEQKHAKEAKPIWRTVRKKLIALYPKVNCPSLKARLVCSTYLLLSFSRPLYYSAYNAATMLRNATAITRNILKKADNRPARKPSAHPITATTR